jgi:biopolymer transport protein TolR
MAKVEEQHQPPGRRARRGRSLHVASSLAEINVVPLVDVMLVLLVIFMVAAPMMKEGVTVHLPTARRAAPVTAPLTISVPVSFRKDGLVRLGEETVPLKFLGERVRQALQEQLTKDVIVAGDGEVTLQECMQVLDVLKAAGVDKAALQTQPANQR